MVDNTDIRQLADLPIANVLFPDQAGPRMLPYNVPLAAGVVFELDLMQAQLTGKENRIQAMEIDNTRGGADVIIQMGFQRIQVCAGELQLIPIYVSGSSLKFYCDVANTLPVKFFNVPMPAYTRRICGSLVYAAGLTATTVILPAIPGRSYVVTGAHFALSGNAAAAAAGNKTFILDDGVAPLVRAAGYVPAAAGAGLGAVTLLDFDGICKKGVEGAALNITFSTALTSGELTVNLNYTLV